MSALVTDLRRSIVLTVLLAVLCGGLYPLVVWGIAHAVFPVQAGGSLVRRDGAAVGSRLIGQAFASPAYFHPRPSAAGAGYDATASGGSNLGPLSKKLLEDVGGRIAQYRRENGLSEGALVPADAVTASASGLDPHISPANARLQAPRVAAARGVPAEAILECVALHIDGRTFGLFGEPRVNVMELNLDLDGRFGRGGHP